MRVADQPQPDETVAILVSEKLARVIEVEVLRPRGLSLSPPIVFDEEAIDPIPEYIVKVPA